MKWLESSLNRKFVVGTASGLLMSSLVFLALFVTMYQTELEAQRVEVVTQVNRLLQTSLENAMLKRDLEGLRFIVDRLGAQSNITDVMITNPIGEIRFSNRRDRIGKQIDGQGKPATTPASRFMTDAGGREVLRSINPVHNRFPCSQCHGPVEKHPVNGLLYVDYDAGSIRHQARRTTLMLMGSGALIVLINIAGGWWFIRRFVIRPVERLAIASEALSRGALDTRVDMVGDDELARFGDTFNAMAANLEAKVRELEEKEGYLQALIDAIPDGVRVIDTEYGIEKANRTYFQQLGITPEEHPRGHCYNAAHHRNSPCPPTLMTCPIHEIARNPAPLKFVHQHQRSDGSELAVEIFAAPMEVTQGGKSRTLIVESIRDLARQVQFSHEQRLSELGRLAAGVAHEIHNPLTSVRLALHGALQSSEAADATEIADYLRLVDREIDTCIEVTERLLKLSATPATQTEVVPVKEAIGETVSLLRWEAEARGIQLELDLDGPKMRVLATDSELRMLTLNMVQNALHAMPQGGKLQIIAHHDPDYVRLVFNDTGVGIAKETLKNIFDPFFSRRADGSKGTGLGLSICQSIVDRHGGSLEVESEPGGGSCFTVRLPDDQSLRADDD